MIYSENEILEIFLKGNIHLKESKCVCVADSDKEGDFIITGSAPKNCFFVYYVEGLILSGVLVERECFSLSVFPV